ncbi:pantoate--beta-alanine ligase [Luteimonas fraxinea]|uniref:Pantothenate synthetase n=1 Tax=Luteimonas fraxinea TaxID=2901869 RepID=A0ABS8UH43_9GAMM|nr:pantoate--beta-alanine ligase [Luteimonas fraxinea]MCD9097810.1 pantoate--beta-alanine ligase [Luteimonas fraxinea]MCD9126469.1 pantoate--beta-alanine ligase [Luteimonas fraxinea]UHH09444.1 pantoate--beta-alanine ligase [Luteimonas fraxinea]
MIDTVHDLAALRARIADWKRAGLRIGLVPTMGNLHAGHFSLVGALRSRVDRVVASVFVNPTQFGPNEDFARYPRTPEQDAQGLAAAGCDLLWLPSVEAMYPLGLHNTVTVRVPGVTEVLDGAHRPGHFDGVATVVARLFNQVQPDVAAFGRKDYQQLAVIAHLVADLAFPVELLPVAIAREADGLAMSSRNQYLDADARASAPAMHAALRALRDAMQGGATAAGAAGNAAAALREAGFVVDYVEVRAPDLAPYVDGQQAAVALAAARLGATRLIDNLEFSIDGTPTAR